MVDLNGIFTNRLLEVKSKTLPASFKTSLGVILIVFVTLFNGIINFYLYSSASDWSITFYPAAKEIFSNNLYAINPYAYFYPTWPLIFVFPLTLLTKQVSNTILSMVCLAVLGYIAYRRGAKPVQLALFVFMPQVQFMARNGDFIDVFTALGFILPPQIGLFFVLVKPQVGLSVAVFWMVRAWQTGGIKEVLRVFAPVSVAYMLLLVFYHPNLLSTLSKAHGLVGMGASHDVNIWPYGMVLGVILLAYAIRIKNIGPAILASVCFAPYIGYYSWPIALLGLLPNKEFTYALGMMWVISMVFMHI